MKNLQNLGKALSKAEQKTIKGQKEDNNMKSVHCTCGDGSSYYVGSSRTFSGVMALINTCKADGGTPSIFGHGF